MSRARPRPLSKLIPAMPSCWASDKPRAGHLAGGSSRHCNWGCTSSSGDEGILLIEVRWMAGSPAY
eukprot:6020950-Alexandrium_andersonii.AAC.1